MKKENKKEKTVKVKTEKEKVTKRKVKSGIEVKIMALILLMAFAAIGCIGILANRLTAVINISDEIVSTQVTEEEKIYILNARTGS